MDAQLTIGPIIVLVLGIGTLVFFVVWFTRGVVKANKEVASGSAPLSAAAQPGKNELTSTCRNCGKAVFSPNQGVTWLHTSGTDNERCSDPVPK